MQLLRYYWVVSHGYRLRPWESPYLRWRMETYSGIPAEEQNARKMIALLWKDYRAVFRFASWTREMRRYLAPH